MGEAWMRSAPFGTPGVPFADTRREVMARARWIALDLDTTRFAVLNVNGSHDKAHASLCFDNEQPAISATSRALLGPLAQPLLDHALLATTPCVWSSDPQHDTDMPAFMHRVAPPCPGPRGIAFPVASCNGQSGMVIFFAHRTQMDARFVYDIHARCFQLFEAVTLLGDGDHAAVTVASRERDCLELSSRGLTSEEIAGELGLSPHTVNQYLTNTARKLGATNRVHVVAKALRLGLIA